MALTTPATIPIISSVESQSVGVLESCSVGDGEVEVTGLFSGEIVGPPVEEVAGFLLFPIGKLDPLRKEIMGMRRFSHSTYDDELSFFPIDPGYTDPI